MQLRTMLAILKAKLNSYPKLKMKIIWIVYNIPSLKNRLIKIYQINTRREINTNEDLSPQAKEIYRLLKERGI